MLYNPQQDNNLHTHSHTFLHTDSFLYSGQLDPSSQIGLSCFLSSQKRHGRGVVASQSVAACGFPHVCSSLYLSPLFFSLPFFWSLLFSAQLSLCSFCFSISFASNLLFLQKLALFPALSLFLPLPKLSSDWGTVLYASLLLPLTLFHQWWLAAACHSACRLLSMGGPSFHII